MEVSARASTQIFAGKAASICLALFGLGLFWSKPLSGVLGLPVIPADIFLVLSVIFFAVAWIAAPNKQPRPGIFEILSIAYFSTILLSAFFSERLETSLQIAAANAGVICSAVLAAALIRRDEDLRIFMRTFIAGSCLVVAVGVAAIAAFYLGLGDGWTSFAFYHYGSVPVGNYPRISATFVSATALCNYLTMAGVVSFAAFERGWISRTHLLLLSAAIAGVAAFTISIALGGAFFAAGLVLIVSRTFRNGLSARIAGLLAIAAAALFLVIAPFSLQPYEANTFSNHIPTPQAAIAPSPRLLVWEDTLNTIAAHPFVGVGAGAPVASVLFRNAEGENSLLTDAHNSFLSAAAKSGIPSALIYLSLLIYAIAAAWRSGSETARLLAIAILACAVFDGLTSSFENARHLWLLIGWTIGTSKLGSGADERFAHSTSGTPS